MTDKGPGLPKFKVINEAFICAACDEAVGPLRNGSCRNHCPVCLVSVHVDDNPGDRAADCGGLMDAVAAEVHSRKGVMIVHRCRRCGAVKRNRAATDDPVQPDDEQRIFALFGQPR